MEIASSPPPLPGADISPVLSPRRAGLGKVVALVVIVVCLGFTMWRAPQRAHATLNGEILPNVSLEMSARYLYGMEVSAKYFGDKDSTSSVKLQEKFQDMAAKAREAAHDMEEEGPTRKLSAADRLRWQVLTDVLDNAVSDADALVQKAGENKTLRQDAQTFATSEWDPHAVSKEQWKELEKRHGWFARLAHAQAYPADSTEQVKLGEDGIRTLVATFAFGLFLIAALISGVVLLILILVRWRDGRLIVVAPRPAFTWGGVLLEGFAIYLLFMTLIPLGLRAWVTDISEPLFYFGILPVGLTLALFWPLLRGVKVRLWRETLGLHLGRGLFREMGIGILGWLAACPLMALCIPIVFLISKYTDTLFDHPIGREFAMPGAAKFYAMMLATIWAPLTEETMFRGLLMPGLASLIRWVGGAFLAAFIFAALHPQGLAAVPLLMTIALMVSALRLTRGSLVASMTAHAMNNGLVVVLLYFGVS